MKKFSVLGFIVGVVMILSIGTVGCKKGEQSAEAPKSASQGHAIVADFEVVNGTLEKSGLGYVLSSEKDKAAVALKKIETPFKKSMIVKGQIKSAMTTGSRNGFIAFGENPKQTPQAGIRIGGKTYKIEGFSVAKAEVPQEFDPNKVFDFELIVNLKEKVIKLKVDGKEIKTPIRGKLEAINYVGYSVWSTKTEFSDLQISGD